MEIFSYLRLTPGRLAALAVATVLGAVVGAAIGSQAARPVDVAATVNVAKIFTPGRPAYETSGYNAAMLTSFRSNATVREVARRAGVSEGTVRRSVTALLKGDLAPIEVTAVNAEGKVAELLARESVDVTLNDVAQGFVADAQQKVAEATAAREQAQTAMDELAGRAGYGYTLPDRIKQIETVELPGLDAQLAGTPAGSLPGVEAQRAALAAELSRLKGFEAEQRPLAAALDSASGSLTVAQQRLAEAQSAAKLAAAPGDAVQFDEPVVESAVPVMARWAVGGAVVSFAAVGLLIFLSDRRRGTTAPAPIVAHPSPPPGPAPERPSAVPWS